MPQARSAKRFGLFLVGAISVAGSLAWAAQKSDWLRGSVRGPHWYVVNDGSWPIDRAMLRQLQSQLGGAQPAAKRRPMPELVQAQSRSWGKDPYVAVVGTCEGSAKAYGNPEARLFDVKEGRDCSFSAELNPKTNKYAWLEFNQAALADDIGGRHVYLVRGGDWQIPPELKPLIQVQLQAAADGNLTGRVRPIGEPLRRRDVSAYIVQIQGRLIDGRRIVDVRGGCPQAMSQQAEMSSHLHEVDDLNWRMMDVLDGGDCFFDGQFDPDAGRFIQFAFHGVA